MGRKKQRLKEQGTVGRMQLMLKAVDQVLDAEVSFSAYSALNTCVHVSDSDEKLLLPPLMNTFFRPGVGVIL